LAIRLSELSRDIQALARDLAHLRAEIECFRIELRAVVHRFFDEDGLMRSQANAQRQARRTARQDGGDRAAAGLFARPDLRGEIPPKELGAVEEDASTKSTERPTVLPRHV
jgi:hypothetical protein